MPQKVQAPSRLAENPRTPEHGTVTRLLRKSTVLDRVGFSKSELHRRLTAGKFPAPVKLGVRAVAWRESDIEGYINSLSQGAYY